MIKAFKGHNYGDIMMHEPSILEQEIRGVNLLLEKVSEGQNTINQRYFVVCQSCFWCATVINFSETTVKTTRIDRCPACCEYKTTIFELQSLKCRR
jgi:hypothetical protein